MRPPKIDGASAWESFWKITLPPLSQAVVVNVIFTVVMQSVFTLNPVIEKIETDMYRIGFGFGYASAMAWVFFVIMVLILLAFAAVYLMLSRGGRRRYD